MAAERIAVLLMAYGGPQSLDDVEPYLRDVRGGRPTPPEFVQEIRQRYARIGGRSPIRELTEAQAAGVRHARSEEHTSELQSRPHLVCRLLLEKKKRKLLGHALMLVH